MRTTTYLLTAILAAFTLCLRISAQPSTMPDYTQRYAARLTPPPVYRCQYTAVPPVIDGLANDSVWLAAEPLQPLQDIQGASMPAPTLPTEIRMLWDERNLYVTATLTEPFVRAKLDEHDAIVWHDNDFEVFLDPDGDGENYFEIEVNALGTVFELMLSHPYRSGGKFFSAWDCPGLQSAVSVRGTLNDSSDRDTSWIVELAIPHKALSVSFDDALKQSRLWRVNFSRVEWLKDGGPEGNWVWAPTGMVDIHMPERWGYVYLEGGPAPTDAQTIVEKPYKDEVYNLLWTLFYAQQDAWNANHRYIDRLSGFKLKAKELGVLPEDWWLTVSTTRYSFVFSVGPDGEPVYQLNDRGHFSVMKKTE
ncbi:MAG: carbohydrate-binding family 9-like protein [Bacteroidaceae bacterium]|nr:carbohydrate-binding family 9-like protein [Bacteroidaceae bacterium]